jgi:hypothetical protein
MHLMALSGLLIKKGIATTGKQQGSHITEVHPCVTEATARRVGRRCYHDLQNEQT